FAAQADAITIVDAGRHLDRQRLAGLHPTLAAALLARIAHHLALAAAIGASLLNGQEALLQAHLTAALTGWAFVHGRTGFRARAVTDIALLQRGNGQLHRIAANGRFQVQVQVITQVGAAAGAAPAATHATAKDIGENIAEDIADTTGARGAE